MEETELNDSKELARKLCEELDIEWDETANQPIFQDAEITSEKFVEIFEVDRYAKQNFKRKYLYKRNY